MKTEVARCSKAVKLVLKNHFPKIKFKVRSSNFANGNSVNVSWNLGPTAKEITDLVKQFQYGRFNGMQDIYEYTNNRKDIPQAKFVQCNREYQTNEEIAVYKSNIRLRYNDPNYRDLWKLEKTLHHVIAKDLCRAMGIEYKGMETVPPEEFQHMVRGYNFDAPIRGFIHQLLNGVSFMEGYHGVRNKRTEEDEVITNSFELY